MINALDAQKMAQTLSNDVWHCIQDTLADISYDRYLEYQGQEPPAGWVDEPSERELENNATLAQLNQLFTLLRWYAGEMGKKA